MMKVLVAVVFLAMIAVNALANILPINGQNTGEVSDSYVNLFAPAGLTFSIWGLIYLLLAAFTLYQLGFFRSKVKSVEEDLILDQIRIAFVINALANAAWVFSWHYHLIPLSMALMLVILLTLITIAKALRGEDLNPKQRFFLRLPFSIYFGWITVATIANMTTLLVSLGWDGFGIPEETWTVIVLIVGFLIASATILVNRDVAYGLVPIWAYAGIIIKHTSASGFAGQYPMVIYTAAGAIVLFALILIYVLFSRNKRQRMFY